MGGLVWGIPALAIRGFISTIRAQPLDTPGQAGGEELLGEPRGSKYPMLMFKDIVSKDHTTTGFWNQGPEILGTWTLWGICRVY